MGRTLTNNFSLAYAVQDSFGVLGASPAWKRVEPNNVSSFAPEISTVARNPISPNRQRKKGTVTDLDAAPEYELDLTMDLAIDLFSSVVFATPTNVRVQSGALFNSLEADDSLPVAVAEGFAHDALASAIPAGQLIFSRGFATAANNGLFEVDAGGSTTETPVAGTPGIVAEVPGNTANASIETAGWRFTDLAWDDTAKALSSASVDPSTIGLTPGQLVYVGGATASERFANGTMRGRVVSVGSGVGTDIVLDKITNDLGTGLDGGGNEGASAVDLLFGRFLRNVSTDDASFVERYLEWEAGYPNLYETDPPTPVANPDGFEYALDALLNSFALSMPGQDKATVTVGFVGTDIEPPVDNASRKTNASTPAEPEGTTAFNTTADFARLRVQDTDETGLTTDITEMTATFLNNVSPEKVLAVLGARFLNYGNFDVDIEMTILFTTPDVPARIRNNTTVSMDWVLSNGDGEIGFDIPSATMSGGGREFPLNESIRLSTTLQAFEDPVLGTSLGLSIIPFVPSS